MPAVCGVTVYPWTTNVPRSVRYTVGQLPLPHKLVTRVSWGGFMSDTPLLSEFTREPYTDALTSQEIFEYSAFRLANLHLPRTQATLLTLWHETRAQSVYRRSWRSGGKFTHAHAHCFSVHTRAYL
jgi:hypothetical protein